MNAREQEAVLSIALLAAFADGAKDDRERDEIKRIAESFTELRNSRSAAEGTPRESGEPGAPQLSQLYQNVLLKRVNVSQAASALTDPTHRQLAYEMAVCVCDADAVASEAEQKFLQELRSALGLDSKQTAVVEREAAALVEAPLPAAPDAQPIGGSV